MHRPLYRIFTILFIIAFLSVQRAESTVDISVPDTTLTRGKIYSIPISCNITEPNVQSLKIIFSYNSYIIDIKNADGGPNYVMNCQPPDISTDLNVINPAKTTVTCNNINPNTSGTLLALNIEGLAGPDTVCKLYVDSVFINGSAVQFGSKTGTILVPGEPIFPTIIPGLGQNYPNPFYNWTKFDFSIQDSTKVEFRVYSILGRQVEFVTNLNEIFVVHKKINNGLIPVDLQSYFTQGNYTLTFTPDIYVLASGVYFLTMKTGSGDYSSSFVFVK